MPKLPPPPPPLPSNKRPKADIKMPSAEVEDTELPEGSEEGSPQTEAQSILDEVGDNTEVRRALYDLLSEEFSGEEEEMPMKGMKGPPTEFSEEEMPE